MKIFKGIIYNEHARGIYIIIVSKGIVDSIYLKRGSYIAGGKKRVVAEYIGGK